MSSSQRLTKKQKKGLAFRERKRKLDVTDVPVHDLQDDAENVQDMNDSHEIPEASPVKSHVPKDPEQQDERPKKRKRDPSTEIPDSQGKPKKSKSTPSDQREESKKVNNAKQQRYILFLGKQ